MKKRLFAALLATLLLGSAAPVRAGGCGWVGCAAPACGVTYVDRVVTCYRAETRTRVVPVQVTRYVTETVPEKVKYVEMVQEVTPTERTETYYVCVPREVQYNYTVNVPVWTPTTVKQTYYTCAPQEVVTQVPVCRSVPCQVCDPCTGCCYTSCKQVTEWQSVRTVVYRPVAQTRDVTVNVCSYRQEQRTGTYTVHEMQPRSRKVTVNVVTCKPVERETTVNRVVCRAVTETVNVTQAYCEMVPYQCTVRVPVAVGCGPVCCH